MIDLTTINSFLPNAAQVGADPLEYLNSVKTYNQLLTLQANNTVPVARNTPANYPTVSVGWIRVRRYVVEPVPLQNKRVRIVAVAGSNHELVGKVGQVLSTLVPTSRTLRMDMPSGVGSSTQLGVFFNSVIEEFSGLFDAVLKLTDSGTLNTITQAAGANRTGRALTITHTPKITRLDSATNEYEHLIKIAYFSDSFDDKPFVPYFDYGLVLPYLVQLQIEDLSADPPTKTLYPPCPLAIVMQVRAQLNTETAKPMFVKAMPAVVVPVTQVVDEITEIRKVANEGVITWHRKPISDEVTLLTATQSNTSTMLWPPKAVERYTATTISTVGTVAAMHVALVTPNNFDTIGQLVKGWSTLPHNGKLISHYVPYFGGSVGDKVAARAEEAANIADSLPDSLLTSNPCGSCKWCRVRTTDTGETVFQFTDYNLMPVAEQPMFVTMLDYIPNYPANTAIIESGNIAFEMPPFTPLPAAQYKNGM
jgi:hypothetical protein